MEKLIFPQGCMIEGSISSIKYGGDIELQTHIDVPKVASGQGDIRLEMSEATYGSTVLSAPEGSIAVEASSLELKSLEAQSAQLKVANAAKLDLAEVSGTFAVEAEQLYAQHLSMGEGKFNVQQLNVPNLEATGKLELNHEQGRYILEKVQADSLEMRGASAQFEELQITGDATLELTGTDEKLQFNFIKAGRLTLEGNTQIEAGNLEVEGEATLTFEKGKFKELRARNLKISGGLECERLVVTEKVEVSSGFVNIRQLECPEFHAEPDVMGIVMVANTEKVVAQGVRGFLRPDEVSFLSSNVAEAPPENDVPTAASDSASDAEASDDADDNTYETQHFETPTVEFPEADVEAAAATEVDDTHASAVVEDEAYTVPAVVEDADQLEIPAVVANDDTAEEATEAEATEDEAVTAEEAVAAENDDYTAPAFVDGAENLDVPAVVADDDTAEEAREAEAADDETVTAEEAADTAVAEEDYAVPTVVEDTANPEVPAVVATSSEAPAFGKDQAQEGPANDWDSDADTATDIDNPFAAQASVDNDFGAPETSDDATDVERIDALGQDADIEVSDLSADELTVDDIDDSSLNDDTDPDAFAAEDVAAEELGSDSESAATEDVGDNTFDSVSDSLDDSDAIESFDADAIEDSGHFEVNAADLEDFDDDDLSVDTSELEDLPAVESFDMAEPASDIQESDLTGDADITGSDLEELSADDLYASDGRVSEPDAVTSTETVDSGGPAATAEVVDFSEEELAKFLSGEMSLQEQLDRILVQIKNLFPDDNYPKFIDQVQNYVAEERFNILIKTRNKEAVMGSFNKLDHPEINRLAQAFYDTLEAGYQG